MSAAIAIVAVLIVVAVVAAIVLRNRSQSTPEPPPDATPTPPRVPRPEPAPMTGLEDALAAVTDSDGRPMSERIDAETGHVDDLRVPDDTGPLLRRALDHVEHAPDGDADDQADTADNNPG